MRSLYWGIAQFGYQLNISTIYNRALSFVASFVASLSQVMSQVCRKFQGLIFDQNIAQLIGRPLCNN
jgi:uncharacterized membrane protein YadS